MNGMEMGATEQAGKPKAVDRRAQIAAAALRCLQQVGHSGLTARKVAAEAGISLGHITYHFKDMDEVLAEAYRLGAAKLQEAGRALVTRPGLTPAERLDAFLRAGFAPEFLNPAQLRMRIDLWSAALTHPAIAATERELYRVYRTQLELLLGQVSDPWKTDRIPMVSDLIMATLDGLWLDWMRRGDETAIKNGLDAVILFTRFRLNGA